MFQRDLKFLRSRLGAPVEYDPGLNGYRFGAAHAGVKHELPGLWFDESELYSLLMAQQLLAGLDTGGLLAWHLPFGAPHSPPAGQRRDQGGAADRLNQVKVLAPPELASAVSQRLKAAARQYESLG